ncbi:MAG TPA: pitrilysin family protein [Longilinea sp.]|nr:pitrilysin family protein [Longilinea sp.]
MSTIPPLNWKSLPGPEDITRVTLSNGITVMARSNFNSPSVALSGYLACGSLMDPEEKLGLAYFTSLALMRGTHQRNFQQIYNALESVGASLGFSASAYTTGFGGRALVDDMPLLLDLLCEGIKTPTFPAEQVKRLRMQLLTGLAIRAQDTEDMASLTFDDLLFEDHPFRLPDDGYIETIKKIQPKDLAQFHKRYFGPQGMVVVVVGGIDPHQAVEMVTAALGNWTNPDQGVIPDLPPLPELLQTKRRHVVLSGKTQTDLSMGCFGPKRSAPEYMAASLGNSVLGQFGMMGRIGDVVREREGLAYSASTSLNAGIVTGTWEVGAGVNPVNLDRAVELIRHELQRFTTEQVSKEELEDSQANFIGRLPLSLESNAGVANALLHLERFELGLDYYQRFPGLVQKVTPKEVLETAHKYIDPDKLVIASAGPELALQ